MRTGALILTMLGFLLCARSAVAQEHDHGGHPAAPATGPAHEMSGHDMHDMPDMAMDGKSGAPAVPSEHAGHDMQAGTKPEAHADMISEREHVPPDPPAHPMGDMPEREMAHMMEMDDGAARAALFVDELDRRNGDTLSWDAYGWYGTDTAKLWLKTEGERRDGHTENGRAEALFDRPVSRWWSVQAGIRHDFGDGPSRDWLAAGIQGLAPYFFDVEATAYVGEQGRAAARLSTDVDVLLTQRLILRPSAEINLYAKSDAANGLGSGLSDADLGLRLRYEFRREFAPYIGVAWEKKFGRTADFARAAGEDSSELQWLAGVRFWY